MNLFSNMRAKVLLVLSLFLFTAVYAKTDTFVLENDNLIDPRAIEKINAMGDEFTTKTGIGVFVIVKEQYPTIKSDDMKEKLASIKLYENTVIKTLKKPYVLLSMSFEDTHINLQASPDIASMVDKDDILDTYIIPVLASRDKNDMLSKVSAAVLNGYGQICDSIAEQKGITLETSIGSGGTTFSAIWKVFMYSLVFIGILLYTFVILREKRRGF
ncbi:MAG: hypothetical protein U9N30_03535 [Campylobacterota bacterium]|nr:hypothetical protein [Campylobacterota bacterium]